MPEQGSHIGTLIKPSGYKGELQLKGNTRLLKNIEIGDPLFIMIDGQRIPFFVEDLYESGRPDRIVIKFEFIDSEEEARKYINFDVYTGSEMKNKERDSLDINSMIGYRVTDQISGIEASVLDSVSSTENPILILKFGNQEFMLPLNADYIEEINHEEKIITVSLPEGLIDL